MNKGVLCDTNFFIHLLDADSKLHASAREYFDYLTTEGYVLYISTISIAEYGVGDDPDNLPMRFLRIIAFSLPHTRRTSEFAKATFASRRQGQLEGVHRSVIPNDTKLFAQADTEAAIAYYLSSDTDSEKIFRAIAPQVQPQFQFLNLYTPCKQAFGLLF